MVKKFDEYIRELNMKSEAFVPETSDDHSETSGKSSHDGKQVSGFKEVVEVEGLGKMKAKFDTGNTAYCAIIVQDFEEKDGKVSFDFNGEKKEFDIVKHIKIWHHGKSTERPVIKVTIKFNGSTYPDQLVDLKISDLTGTKNYRSRMLICKDFMEKANIVIDPSKDFKLTDKKEISNKKNIISCISNFTK